MVLPLLQVIMGAPRTAWMRTLRLPPCAEAATEEAEGEAEAEALNDPGPRKVRVPRESSRTSMSFDLSEMLCASGMALPAG
jgi:hypothetical protein